MARKARKIYSCDFETTTKEEDCRVWAWGYMEIGNNTNTAIGNDLNEFMAFLEKEKPLVYFHNLKFDGSFVIQYLFSLGWRYKKKADEPGTFSALISNMGQWYSIEICYKEGRNGKATLNDSLKKLPFKVSQIAKGFNLPILKGDIDYHKERPVGYTIDDEEKEYINNDIEIVARALDTQMGQGLTKMTNGSDALDEYMSLIGGKKEFQRIFPVFSLSLNEKMRYAYRGGFTWLNDRFKEKDIGEGLVFDVNSLYPSQMYNRELPWGMPIPYKGQYKQDDQYPLYIQHIKIDFQIKDGYIPTIQIKRSHFPANEYLKSSNNEIVDLFVTNVDLEMILEHYHVHYIEYVEGWKFRSQTGLFRNYIDKWMHIKINSTGAIKLLAKLMLNSLYGKFATNPNVTGKVPYLKEDGSTGFKLSGEEYVVTKYDTLDRISANLDIAIEEIVLLNRWINKQELKEGDVLLLPEYRDPVYTPMGVFITSWARYTTIGTAQKCYDRIIYCDTDSIHLTGTELPEAIADIIDDDTLGFWAHETTFKRARYIRQKTYMYEACMNERGAPVPESEATQFKTKVTCAGMSDKIKENVTFDNFHRGFTSYGKLVPKQVVGGVVLEDKKFTLK